MYPVGDVHDCGVVDPLIAISTGDAVRSPPKTTLVLLAISLFDPGIWQIVWR